VSGLSVLIVGSPARAMSGFLKRIPVGGLKGVTVAAL